MTDADHDGSLNQVEVGSLLTMYLNALVEFGAHYLHVAAVRIYRDQDLLTSYSLNDWLEQVQLQVQCFVEQPECHDGDVLFDVDAKIALILSDTAVSGASQRNVHSGSQASA